MTTKDTGGPAFPIPGAHMPNGEWVWGESGMTLRDYFAMQAPKEVPHWFNPTMPPMPGFKWVGGDGSEYANRHEARRAAGEDHWDANREAREQWHRDKEVAQVAQWPWFWADLQLEARKA